MKAQVLKTKTFASSDIKDPSLETKLQGRLLASFQEDAKYEHVDQETRSQGGKEDKDKQGKDLKISESKMKSKDNDNITPCVAFDLLRDALSAIFGLSELKKVIEKFDSIRAFIKCDVIGFFSLLSSSIEDSECLRNK
ncbi:hypothetical protein Tco_1459175 [Tanacetum coccineum]